MIEQHRETDWNIDSQNSLVTGMIQGYLCARHKKEYCNTCKFRGYPVMPFSDFHKF